MSEPNYKQDSTIRAMLKNDYILVAGIVAIVMSFVTTIILPLQRVQIQLAQIQTEIIQTNTDYQTVIAGQASLSNRVTVLETEVNPLLNKK